VEFHFVPQEILFEVFVIRKVSTASHRVSVEELDVVLFPGSAIVDEGEVDAHCVQEVAACWRDMYPKPRIEDIGG